MVIEEGSEVGMLLAEIQEMEEEAKDEDQSAEGM